MATNFQSLLVGGATGWHDGSGRITYSFLGATMPAYYPKKDTNGDGTVDAWKIDKGSFIPLNGNFSMTVAERALTYMAIDAWNEVANVNLVPGTITGTAGGGVGTPVTGDGRLVPAGGTAVPTNDDGFTAYDFSAVFEDGLNFFGQTYTGTSVYVNTNGSISFGGGISTYTPTAISAGGMPMIAPFWADVDTRAGSPIYVDVDPVKDVVTVTWGNVGYYDQHSSPTNSFQLQLYDRGNGDFDIVFRYESINWTTGDASGGSNGLGGTPAHAGFTAGNGLDFFELPQSGIQSSLLALDNLPGNTGVTGLWVFEVRNGVVAGDITFGSADFVNRAGDADTETFGFVADFPKPSKLGVKPTRHGDFWINSNNPDQSTTYGHTGWQTYLHELGHALGLHHPNEDPNNTAGDARNNNQWTVMSYAPHPGEAGKPLNAQGWPLTPMVLDIQALQKLYGANTTTRTGNTTYFGDNFAGYDETAYQYGVDGMKVDGGDGTLRNVILTIWDAGGTDLIDASDLATKVRIDLRPGHYSTIGELKNNIGIAKAVKVGGQVINYIENAEGGSGNDRLVGNATDNRLGGNDGNDVLLGFGGADRLFGDAGRDWLFGGAGRDRAYGGKGHDRLFGKDGRDLLLGGLGKDKLFGGKGNDVLGGGAGNDVLAGSGGRDWLNGGGGDDTLTGGAGRDVFVFLAGGGADRITDFQDDVDTLRLDSGLGIASAADALSHAVDDGTDIVFSFGTDMLVLAGAGGGGTGFLLDDILVV